MDDFYQVSYFISEVIALLGIGLNAFQILHSMRKNSKRTIFDSSIFSLCIADLLSSSFTFAFLIYLHLLHNSFLQRNKKIYEMISALQQYSILSSIFHLLYIAFIRITAVVWPIKIRILITSRFSRISISIIWILSFVFSIVNVFLITADIIGFTVLSTQALFVAIYIIICCAVKKQDIAANRLSAGSQNRPPVFRHAFLHSVFVTSAFILCTLPAALFYVGILNRLYQSYVYEWARWMFYLNPMADSLLYFYFSKTLTRPRHVRFSFLNQWNCNRYSLESARRRNDVEMTKKDSVEKFSLTNA